MPKSEAVEWLKQYFQYLRQSKEWHLGLGDIKLTIGQQDQIVEIVSSILESDENRN